AAAAGVDYSLGSASHSLLRDPDPQLDRPASRDTDETRGQPEDTDSPLKPPPTTTTTAGGANSNSEGTPEKPPLAIPQSLGSETLSPSPLPSAPSSFASTAPSSVSSPPSSL